MVVRELDLTTLRRQLSIRNDEDAIPLQDERVLLAQRWMESTPGAYDLFEVWDNIMQRQNSTLVLIVSIISSLLRLLSSHYTYHSLGQPIIKTLLTPPYMRRLNSYIGGSHSELILVTLKLFNEMSAFAGGREKSSVLDAFGWEIKSLPKILNMRRKTKGGKEANLLVKPDIRTLYISLLLSFIDSSSSAQTKTTFLEQHRDQFLLAFKGLVQDPYSVVRRILEVCWAGIWSDPKIKRTVKIGLFNESTISHILKLYERTISEGDEVEQVPADLIHHFLLAICTRPGSGICFRDRGWYPREGENDERATNAEEDEVQVKRKGGKIYNKILGNVLKTLKVNEDLRQQELALKIMAACPELVAEYWGGAALTLEPRLSSKWIANIAFFGSVISLPSPSFSFHLPNSTLYQPTPPPFSNIMESILPSVNTKAHFSKGLQSSSGLVQHLTALTLAKCLAKFQKVVTFISQIALALEENEVDGQWCKRRREIEKETRRRVPEFQVIVAFSQQRYSEGVSTPSDQTIYPNPIRTALLSESSQRLLWMYHHCLPEIVAEVRFDAGKLLQSFSSEAQAPKANNDDDEDRPLDAAARLHMVRELHVLRLLRDNDQFVLSGKTGPSSQSYLIILLRAFSSSEHHATRIALAEVLYRILSESLMFQEDANELHLWLVSLPRSRRAPGAEAPDGTSLTDEASGVINFLDDCVQRFMKTPYRYIEDSQAFSKTRAQQVNGSVNNHTDVDPSPLLMTVFEQLDAKLAKGILSQSDLLALACYIRKLIFRLTTKQKNLHILKQMSAKLDEILHPDRLSPQQPTVKAAIRREVFLLQTSLDSTKSPPPVTEPAQHVGEFLTHIENISLPVSRKSRIIAAYELIDWLRLVGQPLGVSDIHRVSNILLRFHTPIISELLENLDPTIGLLWDGLEILSRFSALRQHLRFDFLFLHTAAPQITSRECRDVLTEVAFDNVTFVDLSRHIHLIVNRLEVFDERDDVTEGLLFLLASILARAPTALSAADTRALKEMVFYNFETVKSILVSGSTSSYVREGINNLLKSSLDSMDKGDRMLVADATSHWANILKNGSSFIENQAELVSIWIPYFHPADLFNALDAVTSNVRQHNPLGVVAEAVVNALRVLCTSEPGTDVALQQRLPQLLSLQSMMPDLSLLEEMVAIAIDVPIPSYVGGDRLFAGNFEEEIAMTSVVGHADTHWSRRSKLLPVDLPFKQILDQEQWSLSTTRVVSRLLYRRAVSRGSFLAWLQTRPCAELPIECFAPVLHAFLDSSSPEDIGIGGSDWLGQFPRLLDAVLSYDLPSELRHISGTCIILILSATSSILPEFLTIFSKRVEVLPVTFLTAEVLILGRKLHAVFSHSIDSMLTDLVGYGLQWAVRCFSEENDSLDIVVEELSKIVQISPGIKSHMVETVMAVAIQSRLHDPSSLKLINVLLSAVPLKPAVVNRYLQSIVQHPQLFKLCSDRGIKKHTTRNAIVATLYTLFNLHPNNTCQLTHVEPLVTIYGGTLSPSDGQILKIFQLFESQRKVSIASLLSRWSSSPNTASSTVLDAVQNLDPILVLRTCLNFPRWRSFEELSTDKATHHDSQLYDPIFLILLFAQTLTESPPSSAFAWVALFRTNIVSLLIKALSSKDNRIRDAALCQITALWQLLKHADVQEKPHVTHILTLLKDVLPSPSEEPPKRLPSYTTLLLLHALRAIFYPSNFIYPITARFLLQRPELDTTDVPMLYNMLYSSTDDWKKERGWIIRFLSDGMMSTEDWRVLKRRHTWDLLASLFQSSEGDRALRNGIFEVLANLTCNVQATTSLIFKSGLLAWIEMQLITSNEHNNLEWIKILDNIMTIANTEKIELSTKGEWRERLSRCFLLLLDPGRTSMTNDVFPFAVSAILRLSTLGRPSPTPFPALLDHMLNYIKHIESTITIPPRGTHLDTLQNLPMAPFYAHDIHEPFSEGSPLEVWGHAVETLWRVTMYLDNKPRVWDGLSSRLLVWRAIVGAEASAVGEWARKQVVHSMDQQASAT